MHVNRKWGTFRNTNSLQGRGGEGATRSNVHVIVIAFVFEIIFGNQISLPEHTF